MKKYSGPLIIIVLVASITFFAYKYKNNPEKVVQPVVVKEKAKEGTGIIETNTINKLQTKSEELVITSPSTTKISTQPKPDVLTKTYETEVSYEVPENSESLKVRFTLKDDIITDVSADFSMSDGKSRRYQQNFKDSFEPLVIGQSIKNLSLSRVGGASLTTEAFNQAIQNIKNKL